MNLKKLKIIKDERGRSKFAFLSLSNAEERDKAMSLIEGFVLKGCTLKAIKAKPQADPRVRTSESNNHNQNTINYDELSEDALQQLLLNQVCPLWSKEYESCQLQEKQKSHKKLLDVLLCEIKQLHLNNQNSGTNSLKSIDYDRARYLERHPLLNRLYEGIKHAEQFNHYRNKCEFNVHKNAADGRTVVGFRLGSYAANKTKVIKPVRCPLLNEKMEKMIDSLEEFFNGKTSALRPYDLVTHDGHLKHITIRTTQSGCMLIVVMYRTGLDDEQLESEINKLKQFIQASSASFCTSFYVQIGRLQQGEGSKPSELLKHVCGDLHLVERMRNDELLFRISPLAFFQINVKACEILYETVASLADLNPNSILLDICCGVGTIDAVHNAELNNVRNITFYTGLAEDNLSKMLQKAKNIDKNCEIVAILDPPRAGLKNSIIKTIRSSKDITTLIYVSCELKFSKQNLTDLCRPPSKNYPGMPFNLARCVSVDMFPHTTACELVSLFTRDAVSKAKKGNSVQMDVKIDDKLADDTASSDAKQESKVDVGSHTLFKEDDEDIIL